MRTIMKDIFTALLMGAMVPVVLLHLTDKFQQQPLPVMAPAVTTPQRKTHPVRVIMKPDQPQPPDLDSYLVGVLLAEMPASFHEEALKAQAVVARTYTQKAEQTGGKHGTGAVCTDPGCCQGYLSPLDYQGKGGTLEAIAKVRQAVEATSGQVLTYQGELIEATYFSCSGGRTEQAVAVWGTDYPYLQSVESPGEEAAAHYADTMCFSPEELASALGREPEGDLDTWFGEPVLTPGGGIATLSIGNTTYTGPQLRSLLGLPSTAFTVEVREEEICFHTSGYGHRVGMSQYGANAMAEQGQAFPQILAHYYPGTELACLS